VPFYSLEDKVVTISRAQARVNLLANFMLVGIMPLPVQLTDNILSLAGSIILLVACVVKT